MKPKLVEVEWVDARSVYECMSLSDAKLKIHLSERTTLGYVIDKNREAILLAGTYDPRDEHDEEGGADFTIIPRGWIKHIRELAPASESDKEQQE